MDNRLTAEGEMIVALRRIIRAVDLHSHLLKRTSGITGPQLSTLRAVRRLQPVSSGNLARATCIGSATLTGILDRMEENGYVTRTRSREDRRSILLRTTKAGERVLASAPPLLKEQFQAELAGMSERQRNDLLSTLSHVAELMEAENSESTNGPRIRTRRGLSPRD